MKRLFLASAALVVLAAATASYADDSRSQSDSSDSSDSRASSDSSQPTTATVNGASATGTGTVVVFTPVTITQTQGLNFGAIASGAAGTVAIDAQSGARAVAGGVTGIATNTGEYGTFTVTGQRNAEINVYVGRTISGFAGGITGTTRVSSLPNQLHGLTASFTVGGALNIPANSRAGVYNGTYDVAVNYP